MAGKDLIQRGEKRRREIARFIRNYTKKHGYSPSMSEIGDAVGIASPNAVRGHLVKMQEAGVLTMQPRIARSIRLLEDEPVA